MPQPREGLIESVGVLFVVVVLAIMVTSGFVALLIAESKGRSGPPYFVLGFLLPPIGILAAGFMAPVESAQRLQPGSGPRSSDHRLAILRPDGDATTRAFLRDYQGSLDRALRSCTVGELVLAYGRGFLGVEPVVFVLTDQRFVIVNDDASRARSQYAVDGVALSEDEAGLAFPDGVVYPHASSPFSISEIAALLGRRDQPPISVEVVAPGELALPKPPEPHESVMTPVHPSTDTVGELERIDALHRSGAIDDDEFAELKRRLVWGDGGSTESNG